MHKMCKIWSIFGIFLLSYLILVGAQVVSVDETNLSDTYRLPNIVKPKEYFIEIIPNLEEESENAFTFQGFVNISFELISNSSDITFHSRNLTFVNISLSRDKIPIAADKFKVKTDLKKDFKILQSLKDEKFEEGNYNLEIKYIGILHNDNRGFYRSSYINDEGTKVWLGATHFEPVGARRAFPCFDEPEYKAEFVLNIKHDKKYFAISNMEPNTTKTKSEITETTFKKTPLMSTYLLAFVVSDFKKLDNAHNFSVIARPNAYNNGKLALEKGVQLLKKLEEYTNITFKLGKMDQAAIPDFAAGAMENWGLVLYREKSLLFDPKITTTSEKQNIVETIAHEFAHQWFGNLVSPKWWKYTWLNEGFANFFQSYITEEIEPEWRSVDQSVVKSIQTTAFNFDSKSKTHPINHDVETPEEINAIFDSISYQKGGAVIRMMQHFLTKPVFRKALQNYLSKNEYKAATSDELFDKMQEVIEFPKTAPSFKDIMNKWVNQKGYPVVTVTRNYNEINNVEIKQERFFAYNASKKEREEELTWDIPINYATTGNNNFTNTTTAFWLTTKNSNISINVNATEWLILNKQQTGYYRVNYDEKNWKLISDYLNSENYTKVHVLNRAQLINDALAFVQQGKLKVETLLQLTRYLKNETDYIAWYPGFKTFEWLNTKLKSSNNYTLFKDYVLNVTNLLLEKVGYVESEKDDHLTKLKRIDVINWACRLDNSTCKTNMHDKLSQWVDDRINNTILPNLKPLVLCHGIRTANFELWNRTLAICINTTDTYEKAELIKALGCSTDKDILRYYLNYTVSDDSQLSDHVVAVIESVRDKSDIGVNVTLDFIIERYISIFRKIKNEERITELITRLGDKITTNAQLEKLKEADKKDIPHSIIDEGITSAEKNIKWLKENENAVFNWIIKINSPNGVEIISGSFKLMMSSLLLILYVTFK